MVKVYDEDDNEITLPIVWEICCECEGHGKSSAYLGAYTQSEWDEQGEDFHADYMRGDYDRHCLTCNGTGKVQEVDYDRLSPEHRTLYDAACRAEYEYRQMDEMERRMGC